MYHGHGPDGYRPGPLHGVKTNLDQRALVADRDNRAGVPGALTRKPNWYHMLRS